MEILSRAVSEREASIDTTLGRLAYKRLQLQKEIEEIDLAIATAEGMAKENRNAKNDLAAEAAIAEAKKQKEDALAKQEAEAPPEQKQQTESGKIKEE
jgi:hypothetical protein